LSALRYNGTVARASRFLIFVFNRVLEASMKLVRRSLGMVAMTLALGSFPLSFGCTEDEAPPASPSARAAQDKAFADAARLTVRGYATVGRATHDEVVRLAKLLEKAVEDFIKAPSPELLAGAKSSWRAARDAYSRAEAYRFTGGPFEEDVALAARVETAPVDVTLLEGPTLEAGGILDELMNVPDVTGDAVRDAARGKNVQLGWHALEGMLYGAAVTSGGPPRPHTDFVNAGPNERNARRGKLMAKLARILIEDLDLAANQWDQDRTDSFAQKLARGSLDVAFKTALVGAADFAANEMAGRKLSVLNGAPEISDASDSTRSDLGGNALGLEGLFFAREGRVTAPSFLDLVRRDDPALADALIAAIAASRASVERCPAVLAEATVDPQKRQAAEESRAAHLAVSARIRDVLRHYALEN
jgi:putative iron-regulated protein